MKKIYKYVYIKKKFGSFWPIFDFELREKGPEPSRAELKILQLGSDSSLVVKAMTTVKNSH